jgi:hypothetical protein
MVSAEEIEDTFLNLKAINMDFNKFRNVVTSVSIRK